MSDSPLNTQSMNTCEKALPRLLGMKRRRGSEASASIYLVKRTLGLNSSAQREYRLQEISRL
jgi:hypothetical protein